MAGIRLKITGLDPLRRKAERAKRDVVRDVGSRMPLAAAAIFQAIRRGNFFDNPTPKLQRTMTVGRIQKRGAQLEMDIGWGVPYGRVLEFGPLRRRIWTIKPKRGKVLRFKAGGGIVFARSVTRVWEKSQLRPHVGPTIFRLRNRLIRILGKPPEVLFRER